MLTLRKPNQLIADSKTSDFILLAFFIYQAAVSYSNPAGQSQHLVKTYGYLTMTLFC